MALIDTVIGELISSIPTYVWIGVVLILLGVFLSVIPFIPRSYGFITFISGILIIGGGFWLNNLWQNSQVFRIGVIAVAAFAVIMTILLVGTGEKKKK